MNTMIRGATFATPIAALIAVAALNTGSAFRETRIPTTEADVHAPSGARRDGPAVQIGNGTARTYVVLDVDNSPIEIGVAIDAAGLEGLPQHDMVMNRLRFPAGVPAPYTFAMFDWNPMGHEPPGIYDLPHFDFHFYLTPESEVDAIVPGTPTYESEANFLPAEEFVAPFHTVLAPPGVAPAAVAVPAMGVHHSDVRSPELQGMLGNPAGHRPFTKTFIYGSWNGEITFLEPMITRDYLLMRTDELIPISKPAEYAVPGWYPSHYLITFDEVANEYRIALTNFERHD